MADENTVTETRVSLGLDPEAVIGTIEDYDDDTASYLSPATTALTEAFNALTAIHDAKAAAADDPTLNDAGRLLKTDDYANRRMAKVWPLWEIAEDSLNSKVAAWEAELSKDVESKASRSISGELRSHFKSLKTGERLTAIQKAIREGDEVVATAVLGAPGMLSGLDEEMKAVLHREWNERVNPGLTKRLRAVKQMQTAIQDRVPVLRKAVKKAVGTIKVKGSTFEMHGQFSGEITPEQLRAKKGKSDKPFAVGL